MLHRETNSGKMGAINNTFLFPLPFTYHHIVNLTVCCESERERVSVRRERYPIVRQECARTHEVKANTWNRHARILFLQYARDYAFTSVLAQVTVYVIILAWCFQYMTQSPGLTGNPWCTCVCVCVRARARARAHISLHNSIACTRAHIFVWIECAASHHVRARSSFFVVARPPIYAHTLALKYMHAHAHKDACTQ